MRESLMIELAVLCYGVAAMLTSFNNPSLSLAALHICLSFSGVGNQLRDREEM